MSDALSTKPLSIAVLAMGGQGGGVQCARGQEIDLLHRRRRLLA
jgi:hypothetical protein